LISWKHHLGKNAVFYQKSDEWYFFHAYKIHKKKQCYYNSGIIGKLYWYY
jgi:hypothetical protein